MTAQKPPDKTLVGMPADLKAVLQKLDQATADKSAFGNQPRGSAFAGNHTRAGNPEARRPRTVPPPLSADQGGSAPQPASGPKEPEAMDRTLIGMPSNMQEALARAIAEQAHAPAPVLAPSPAPVRAPYTPPTAAGPALRAQPVRAVGLPNASSSEAQVPVFGARAPVRAPKPTVAASFQPAPPTAAQPYATGHGYQAGPDYNDLPQQAGMKVLAPQAPLDWPPAARRSEPDLAPVREESAPEPGPSDLLLKTLDVDVPPEAEAYDAGEAATVHAPRLALPFPTEERRMNKNAKGGALTGKRWLVGSVLGLAVVLAGVIAWRAPQLLPGPLAALFPGSDHADPPAAADAPTLPALAAPVVTDTAAATDPVHFATPTRPPAAPAMTSGSAAQLEKKAIERLIANDYPAAKQLYEKLRSAEPTRPEFSVMVELLGRNAAAVCGQPGQAPCAGAQP